MTGANDPMSSRWRLLAGGLATRLRPITETIPKALVDVNGRPFIAWQLELAARAGVPRASSSARATWANASRTVVGDGARIRLAVRLVVRRPERCSARPAPFSRALPLLDGPFFVLYGDSYLPIAWRPVQEAFVASGQPHS